MKTFKLIPALDCSLLQATALIARVDAVEGVYGYKVGFALGLSEGLPRVVQEIRRLSKKPIIYDHQKAATDIPDTGALFAATLADAGIDEAILFPQAGPETLAAWAKALAERSLKVIVGGAMTHPRYLASEGGLLLDERVLDLYPQAAALGVRSFVVPLTRPELAEKAAQRLGPGEWEFYSPGLGAQGGDPRRFEFLQRHYAIVGRALLSAGDPAAWVRAQLEEPGGARAGREAAGPDGGTR